MAAIVVALLRMDRNVFRLLCRARRVRARGTAIFGQAPAPGGRTHRGRDGQTAPAAPPLRSRLHVRLRGAYRTVKSSSRLSVRAKAPVGPLPACSDARFSAGAQRTD